MKKHFLFLIAILAFTINVSAQSWTPVITDVNGNRMDCPNRTAVGGYHAKAPYQKMANITVVYQNGYIRSNGTYVRGHYKTRPNNTNWDNFSTIGNTNPYTGSIGSVAQDYTPKVYNYGSGRTIYTGSRGGQYYINSNGNKTYVPKRSNKRIW